MKFSSKLILSFGCILLLMIALGIISQYLNNSIKDQVIEESEVAVAELESSANMGAELYSSLINIQYYLDEKGRGINNENFQSREVIKKAKENVEIALEKFDRHYARSEELADEHETYHRDRGVPTHTTWEILSQLKEKSGIYKSLIQQIFNLSKENYGDARQFFSVTVEPYFRSNLIPLIDLHRERTQKNLDQELEKLNVQLSEVNDILSWAFVFTFLVALGLSYYLYRSIAQPAVKLADAAKKIGEGNLDERIEIESNDELGQLAGEFNRMAENLDKTTFSKEYVDNIIESMADALIVTDDEGNIKKVNGAALLMLGYSEEELLGSSLELVFAEQVDSGLSSVEVRDIYENYETRFRNSEGDTFPVSLSRTLMLNPDGSVKGLVCVASDITERKQAEQQIKKSLKEKEILLAEIHHRVKNNLAVITSLLQMQIWETEHEAAETALRDSQLRVQSIALVHEKLYQSENLSYIEFDKYIRDLLQAISSTYMDLHSDISISTDLEKVILNINQAIPCSLLLNELIVNAYKHAFGKNYEGTVNVDLVQQDEMVKLSVRDNGSGIPDNFTFNGNGQSLGMSLIDTLVEQLQGDIKAYNNGGAVFEIHFKREEAS